MCSLACLASSFAGSWCHPAKRRMQLPSSHCPSPSQLELPWEVRIVPVWASSLDRVKHETTEVKKWPRTCMGQSHWLRPSVLVVRWWPLSSKLTLHCLACEAGRRSCKHFSFGSRSFCRVTAGGRTSLPGPGVPFLCLLLLETVTGRAWGTQRHSLPSSGSLPVVSSLLP